MTELGLFPLPLVLLPTEQVPLHIFEERYQDLIGECLEDETEFGLVFADDDGIREIGTRAAVIEVLDRLRRRAAEHPRRGQGAVPARRAHERPELPDGRVTPVEDDHDPPETPSVERARGLFSRLRELTGSDIETPEPETPQLSFVLASRVELMPEVKLELLSETLRASSAGASVRAPRGRGGHRGAPPPAAERAATNGKVDLDG